MKKTKEQLLNFIEKNKYKISICMILIVAILGYIGTNIFGVNSISNILDKNNIISWITNTEKAFTLWSNIKFYSLLLVSYEMFLIITNKDKKLSGVGTLLIGLSGFVQWNMTKIDSLILGELIIVLLNKCVFEKNNKKNILYQIEIVACLILYSHTYIPFAVTFSLIFVSLAIWIFAENSKELKKDRNKVIGIVCSIILGLVLSVVTLKIYPNQYNDYFEKGFSIGTTGLLSYLYNPLLPFKDFSYNALFGGIICLFPIPMLYAIYYLYKHEEHTNFLMPLTVMIVIEIFLSYAGFSILQKIPVLQNINTFRIAPAIEFGNLLILIYFFSNIEEKKMSIVTSMRATILSIIVLYFLLKYPSVYPSGIMYLFVCEFTMYIFLFLNYVDKRYKKMLIYSMILASLISGVPVCLFI